MKVAVVGVGNVLMKDEGVGIAVVEELKRMGLDVDIYDCGTAGIDILNTIAGYDKVVLVDAVKGFGRPGDVVRIRPDDVKAGKSLLSLHDIDLQFLLKMADGLIDLPEIVIIGIEVCEIGEGVGLSDAVRKAIPKAVKEILKEIS